MSRRRYSPVGGRCGLVAAGVQRIEGADQSATFLQRVVDRFQERRFCVVLCERQPQDAAFLAVAGPFLAQQDLARRIDRHADPRAFAAPGQGAEKFDPVAGGDVDRLGRCGLGSAVSLAPLLIVFVGERRGSAGRNAQGGLCRRSPPCSGEPAGPARLQCRSTNVDSEYSAVSTPSEMHSRMSTS